MSVNDILPSDIDTSEHPKKLLEKWDYEEVARWLVEYCQEHGNQWQDIPIKKFLKLHQEEEGKMMGVDAKFITQQVSSFDDNIDNPIMAAR